MSSNRKAVLRCAKRQSLLAHLFVHFKDGNTLAQRDLELAGISYRCWEIDSVEIINVRDLPFSVWKQKSIDSVTDLLRQIEEGRSHLARHTSAQLDDVLVHSQVELLTCHTLAVDRVRTASS